MLGEHIHCRWVVGAVTSIKSLHLWHEVEEEASHPLLALWKPEEKKKDHSQIKMLSSTNVYTHADKKQPGEDIYRMCVHAFR